MKSPGKLLREAREERGLTLDDVAAMTRIPRGMLEHLEEDRFEEYGADVFARGHLRNYAQELRVDVDEVFQAYKRHTGRWRRQEDEPAATVATRRNPVTDGRSSLAASGELADVRKFVGGIRSSHIVAAVLVLAGVFLVFGYLSNNRATAQDQAEYQEAEESDWELEEDVEQTRWLLEQESDQ